LPKLASRVVLRYASLMLASAGTHVVTEILHE